MRKRVLNGSRREFLRGTACGLLGGMVGAGLPSLAVGAPGGRPGSGNVAPSRAALVHGDDRAANVFRALELIKPQIRARLAGKKRVVIKPNMVSISRQLAATHAGCLEGLLEFFAPLFDGEIIVAESPAGGTAAEGFDNYGYTALAKKYAVRFVDLDLAELTVRHVIDHRFVPHPVRFSKLLVDPDVYLVSAAVPKTHDRAVVTLSLKNTAVGAIAKDTSFRWGRGNRAKSDKPLVHGGRGNAGIHYNLFRLAADTAPDLAVLDGFEGMEHNGPVGGEAVPHRIALASTDWLAADRVAVDLMGFDFDKVGYLKFCADAGMGQGDPDRIEVVGEKVSDHVRSYRPHDSIEAQYRWLEE